MELTDEELLEKYGWEMECISPLEIRHIETGSFASLLAANYTIDFLRTKENDSIVNNGSLQNFSI